MHSLQSAHAPAPRIMMSPPLPPLQGAAVPAAQEAAGEDDLARRLAQLKARP